MAGFRKAKAEQAAMKVGMYGPQGSGKTLTALLIAEYLAAKYGKRIAMVDTERGSDFYTKDVPERTVHPKAFDFDAVYTKSITDILDAVRNVDPKVYCALIIDSMTHVWESTRNSYEGKTTRYGAVPLHAWGKLKKPYKDLMSECISSPLHVFFLGRQGLDYKEDESGESKVQGYKMRAETETPYEPHILLRMEAVKQKGNKVPIVTAFAEKDRSSVLSGKTIEWPNGESIAGPVLPLLEGTQGRIESDDDVAAHDAEKLSQQEANKGTESSRLLEDFRARLTLAKTKKELDAVTKDMTASTKKRMMTADVNTLRELWQEAENRMAVSATQATKGAK